VFRVAVERHPQATLLSARARTISRKTAEGAGRGLATVAGAMVQRSRQEASGELSATGDDEDAVHGDSSGY
jgi:hypothetical protein